VRVLSIDNYLRFLWRAWTGVAAIFIANETVSPVSTASGKIFYCTNGRWTGDDKVFYVPPADCTFVPTTLTVTNASLMKSTLSKSSRRL
jgi:hypothetical protein